MYGVFIGFFFSLHTETFEEGKIRARKMRKFHSTVKYITFFFQLNVKNEQLLRIHSRLVDSFAFFHSLSFFFLSLSFSTSCKLENIFLFFYREKFCTWFYAFFLFLFFLFTSSIIHTLIFHSCWKMLMKNLQFHAT